MLYDHFSVRSTARSVTIGVGWIQVKSGPFRSPWNDRNGSNMGKTPLLYVKSGVFENFY